jgi:tRNA(Arg) A34 adenosine deaminase TadA
LHEEPFLNRAIALARDNARQRRGGPFGAVIVRDGELIAEGVNQVTAASDPTAHAEVVAIRNATAKLRAHSLAGCEIYASCEPCPMCLGAIYWARLDRIYFAASRFDAAAAGFDDQFLYEEFALPFAQRRIPVTQLAVLDSTAPFDAWNADHGKIRY